MKILKIILNYLIILVLLFAVPSLSLLYIFNSFLSKDTISNIMNSIVTSTVHNANVDENTYIHTLLDETLSSSEIPKEVLDYIDFNTINESLSSYYSNFIKYELGIIDGKELQIDDLKSKINEAVDNYEKQTGNEINTDFMNEYLDGMNDKVKDNKNIPGFENYQTYLRKTGEMINPINMIILSVIIVVCLILLGIINKSISFPIKSLLPITLLNALGLGSITFLANNIVSFNTQLTKEIINTLTKVVNRVVYTSAIITVILIISLIIITIIEKNKKKEETTLEYPMTY